MLMVLGVIVFACLRCDACRVGLFVRSVGLVFIVVCWLWFSGGFGCGLRLNFFVGVIWLHLWVGLDVGVCCLGFCVLLWLLVLGCVFLGLLWLAGFGIGW